MTGWSSSHFLQSLGWAILNSFWQMAFLWLLFIAINHFVRLNASKRYQLSVGGIAIGFVWFLFTFLYYLQSSPVSSIAFFNGTISESDNMLQAILLSASLAYLGLLVFPSYRLYRNWKFVRTIKKHGLVKAGINYRLFVQKVAAQMGISKKVMVYASELVKSPVTIGYLKPVILVPVAALNNLSTQQVEAILLHELSHIRRFDYLVNFMLSIINTILYFNPFVKQFMKNIEEERENCCDELVLQFGYDKLGYASALLTLEKLSSHQQVLALCATGKNYLLSRIEKIVGLEKKKAFRINHLAGLVAALFCIILLNSVLIIKEKKDGHFAMAYDNMGRAFNFFNADDQDASSTLPATGQDVKNRMATVAWKDAVSAPVVTEAPVLNETKLAQVIEVMPSQYFMQVAQDDIDASLTREEKEKVKLTVAATKKIISTLQWKEVDKAIADAMTEQEKSRVKMEYMKTLEAEMDLKNLEHKLKAQYEQLNWEQINSNVNKALAKIQLDSLEKAYSAALVQFEKASAEAHAGGTVAIAPMPDQSVKAVQHSTEEIRKKVECIQAARQPKKVVRL